MAYLRQQLLQGLRPISFVYHQLNHRCRWSTPGVSQRALQLLPVFRALVFKVKHGGSMLKMHVLRHQVEQVRVRLLASATGKKFARRYY